MALACALAISVSALAAGAAQADGGFTPIKNPNNGKCLQPASNADAARIIQKTCNGTSAQTWLSIPVGTNHFRFQNFDSRLCFDAFDGAFNGARLLQGSCAGISNEEFNTGARLPGLVKLETRVGFRDTGFCVDIPNDDPTEDKAMQIFRCNGTTAQQWLVGFVNP
ncbi:MAG: RICIN domain-containing protein [Labedaea sp.]